MGDKARTGREGLGLIISGCAAIVGSLADRLSAAAARVSGVDGGKPASTTTDGPLTTSEPVRVEPATDAEERAHTSVSLQPDSDQTSGEKSPSDAASEWVLLGLSNASTALHKSGFPEAKIVAGEPTEMERDMVGIEILFKGAPAGAVAAALRNEAESLSNYGSSRQASRGQSPLVASRTLRELADWVEREADAGRTSEGAQLLGSSPADTLASLLSDIFGSVTSSEGGGNPSSNMAQLLSGLRFRAQVMRSLDRASADLADALDPLPDDLRDEFDSAIERSLSDGGSEADLVRDFSDKFKSVLVDPLVGAAGEEAVRTSEAESAASEAVRQRILRIVRTSARTLAIMELMASQLDDTQRAEVSSIPVTGLSMVRRRHAALLAMALNWEASATAELGWTITAVAEAEADPLPALDSGSGSAVPLPRRLAIHNIMHAPSRAYAEAVADIPRPDIEEIVHCTVGAHKAGEPASRPAELTAEVLMRCIVRPIVERHLAPQARARVQSALERLSRATEDLSAAGIEALERDEEAVRSFGHQDFRSVGEIRYRQEAFSLALDMISPQVEALLSERERFYVPPVGSDTVGQEAAPAVLAPEHPVTAALLQTDPIPVAETTPPPPPPAPSVTVEAAPSAPAASGGDSGASPVGGGE